MKKLNIPLKLVEVEVNETFIDEDGKEKDRTRKIMVPTGSIVEQTANEQKPDGQ